MLKTELWAFQGQDSLGVSKKQHLLNFLLSPQFPKKILNCYTGLIIISLNDKYMYKDAFH